MPRPTNTQDLIDFNVQRHRDGAARQVARARKALPKLSTATADAQRWRTPAVLDRYIMAVKLRIKYPKATVTELAEKSGMPRGEFWSVLRRALRMADRMPDNDEWALFR